MRCVRGQLAHINQLSDRLPEDASVPKGNHHLSALRMWAPRGNADPKVLLNDLLCLLAAPTQGPSVPSIPFGSDERESLPIMLSREPVW